MNYSDAPVPSVKSLIMASLFAVTLAVLILITAVLPAEFGIDPTGLGQTMGFTVLTKQQHASKPITSSCQEQLSQWTDSITLIVPANSGLEYKFHLQKNATLAYAWATDGATIYYDLHGEPQGDTSGYFKSFQVNTENNSTGSLTSVFEGPHGWYWENKSRSPITILLNTRGTYQTIGLLHP